MAFDDGAECIAEMKVLLVTGRRVPKEAKELFDRYIKECFLCFALSPVMPASISIKNL